MLGVLWLAAALSAAPQAAVGLDVNSQVLVSRPEFERAVISSDGKLLAVSQHEKDGTFIFLFNTKDLSMYKAVNTGSDAEISDMVWLGSQQLVFGMARRWGPYAAPVDDPKLYLLRMDSKHSVEFPGGFIGTISHDDNHVLAVNCKGVIEHECKNEVVVFDTNDLRLGSAKSIAVAPLGDAGFTADHAGAVRFAWGTDNKERSRLYVTDNGKDWTLINDSDASGVNIYVEAITRDNKSAIFEVEHKQGPNSLERYDFATGTRTVLLQDNVSNPLSIIYSLDLLDPIGALFGPGQPQPKFWNPTNQDVLWRMAITKAFPNTISSIESASQDGNMVVVRTVSDRDPGSYYLFDRVQHKVKLLFPAYPTLDSKRELPAEPFTMQARDGLTLTGFVTRPARSFGLSPMIVMVHGGPYFIRDDWEFDSDTQLLAQHGYVVLRVNFRGSDGFGVEFQRRGYMQWGAAMQDDVTDATRWAIKQGIADPKRICIYGASYGGYAALMGVVREPNLYRCAAAMAGVYDLNKQYSWGDIHRSDLGIYYLQHVLGDNAAQLTDRSPSAHAADIKIPVLLAHGHLDSRVPIYHAEEMRDNLTKAGNPPIYLDYPGEGHGLADTEHRIDFYTHLLNFFDANLSPSAANAGTPAYVVPDPQIASH